MTVLPDEDKAVDPTPLIAPVDHDDDQKSGRIATLKTRLKIVMTVQHGIQLLGILYVYIYGGLDISAGCMFASSMSLCVMSCVIGMIGIRRNDVRSLEYYCASSETGSMIAGYFVFIGFSLKFMREKENSGIQTTTTLMGMDPIEAYAYLYFALVGIVELTQAVTTSSLIWVLNTPKSSESLPTANEKSDCCLGC